MEQNRPTNPFTSGVSTAAPDSFQAAIDYLLKGKQQTTAQRQGLFTQPAPAATPTTNVTNVVQDVFGDRYRSSSRDSNNGVDPVTGQPLAVGNPYSGKSLFATPTYKDIAGGLQNLGTMQRNLDNLSKGGSFIGGLFDAVVPGALFAKHVVPWAYDQFNDYQYGRYLEDQDARAAQVAATQGSLGGQVGTYLDKEGNIGTITTQDMIDAYDRATFGITSAGMDAQRAGANSDLSTGPGDSSGLSSGGGRGVDGASNDSGYSGPSGDYGRSGAANDRD